jgi:hypothetical protein
VFYTLKNNPQFLSIQLIQSNSLFIFKERISGD